jgi:DNA modification methylase
MRVGIDEPAMQYEMRFGGFGDTAFSENRNRHLHRWVPWIAGYSSSFVSGVLDNVKRDNGPLQVLDPFAGVGTTLIAAIESGDNAIGFEINPYAVLACRAKLGAVNYDVSLLETAIEYFDDFGDDKLWLNVHPTSVPPPAFRSRVPFFSPNVETQVLACLDFIQEETVGWVRELFQLALGSVMVSFSNYSYEPSLGTRAAAGKPNIEQADVHGIMRRKLWDMYEDIVNLQNDMAHIHPVPTAKVYPLSYMENTDCITPQSVDIVITSPPYLNNYHYIRNTRPQLFWLGMVSETSALKIIERKSFGQFWQTVRMGPEISLRPHLPNLAEQIQELRSLYADRGAYGGPGWANYAASYFNDCQRFCQATKPLMRSGGTVVVVIGNNIIQGMEFQTDRLFAEIAETEGFEIIGMHLVRSKRTGNSVVNSSVRVGTVSKPTRLYETAVELRSP